MTEALERILEGGQDRFRPYSAYKDSRVEWLGEIPAHWEVKRLRTTVTSCQNGVWGGEPDGMHDVACVRVADFDRATFRVAMADPTLRCVEAGVVAARGLRAGDLLLEKSGGGENQPVGAVVVYDHDLPAVCSNFIARVTIADGYEARFITYLHAALYALRINTRHIKQSTGIQNLDSWSYLSEATGLPPLAEQRTIAVFLDRETARIDALLAKKERLIELLREKRTALITRAVTKGLDPNVPMRDSGVEWLGEIPAHWEVQPIRALARPGYKTFTDGDWIESPFIRDEGIRLIQTGNVGVGEYKEQGFRYIDEETFRAFRCTEVLPGDVLICRLADPVGRACLAPHLGCRMITSVDVCILKPAREIHAAFVVYALTGSEYLAWLGGICRGGTRDRVSRSMLGVIRVQSPPLAEQRAIATFLDRETARIDALVAKVRDAIDRLNELRTALISAAVTGKIDVREEVA